MSNAGNELAEKLQRQHEKTEENCFENLPEETSADVLARRRRSVPNLASGLVEKQRERMESAVTATSSEMENQRGRRESAVTATSSEGYPETRDRPAKSVTMADEHIAPEKPTIAEPDIVEAEPPAIAEEQPEIAAESLPEVVRGVENDSEKDCATTAKSSEDVARLGTPIVFRDGTDKIHTVYAERGHLGLALPTDKFPIVVKRFTDDGEPGSYGKQLGIQIGWTMISFAGVELSSLKDGVSEAEAVRRIMELMREHDFFPDVVRGTGNDADKDCTTKATSSEDVARLGIPIVFRDCSNNTHTVYAERGPLGLTFASEKIPIVIKKFRDNGEFGSYGKQLGIQIGWTMISFAGVELSSFDGDGVSEAEVFQRIMQLMREQDLRPEVVPGGGNDSEKDCTTTAKSSEDVARLGIPIIFKDSSLNRHIVYAERGPLGLQFPFNKIPIVVTKFMDDGDPGSYGKQLGIQIGWTMISFAGVELSSLKGDGVSEAEAFRHLMQLMKDKLKELDQSV